MTKTVLCVLLCASCMYARENPFETTDTSATVGKTTLIEEKRTDFESTTLKLPSSARILKSVSVTFQNLDGSISEEIQNIEKNIDWHNSLILSSPKNVRNKPQDETPISLPITKPETTKKTDIVASKQKMIPSVVTHAPSLFRLSDTVKLDIHDKELKIVTKDMKVRDFLISDPFKVVVDFQKVDSFSTKSITLEKAPFLSATLGNHEAFYRVAIALDGQYRYDIQKVEDGYLIRLK